MAKQVFKLPLLSPVAIRQYFKKRTFLQTMLIEEKKRVDEVNLSLMPEVNLIPLDPNVQGITFYCG